QEEIVVLPAAQLVEREATGEAAPLHRELARCQVGGVILPDDPRSRWEVAADPGRGQVAGGRQDEPGVLLDRRPDRQGETGEEDHAVAAAEGETRVGEEARHGADEGGERGQARPQEAPAEIAADEPPAQPNGDDGEGRKAGRVLAGRRETGGEPGEDITARAL